MTPALKLVERPPEPRDPDAARAAENWLRDAKITYLLCRGRHAFPKLAPNAAGKLPRGTRVYEVGPNLHEVHLPCRDCGLPLVMVLRGGDPRHVIDKWYDYKALPGYLQPKGSSAYIHREDCLAEAAERTNLLGALEAAARKPAGGQ